MKKKRKKKHLSNVKINPLMPGGNKNVIGHFCENFQDRF